ncbi:MAG TPA: flavoprotein [Thermoanaerobaculia bacterium]|nr:flavoprotein [Thermoanaerobaculia bacterium]
MSKVIRLKRLLLCVSGGFQAYSVPGFVLSLLKHVADDVRVVLSRPASRMTSRYAVEVASRHPVFVELDDVGDGVYVPHIELSRDTDAVLVYPATVNVLGKVANGIADELIAALILAAEVPVFFIPVTNPAMWSHPAVQRNVAALRGDGYVVLDPPPAIEVATREGIDETADAFPLPTLLLQLSAAVREGSTTARARRHY